MDKVENKNKPTTILFLCVGNTCRSQMAEGFAKSIVHREGSGVRILSAGTSAMGVVNGDSIRAMSEVGIDISHQTSDQVTDEMLGGADVLITLGCCSIDELCGIIGKSKDIEAADDRVKEDWPIKDPLGRPWDFMEMVRDDIDTRVHKLMDELGIIK